MGNTRVDLQVDLSFGSNLFPLEIPEVTEGTTFFKAQQPLRGYFQSVESLAADKIETVIAGRSDTTRWKDFADLDMLGSLNLDPRKVAGELVHLMRKRGKSDAEIMALLPQHPDHLAASYAADKAAVWKIWESRNRHTDRDFNSILDGARKFYAAVRSELVNAREQHMQAKQEQQRRPRRPRSASNTLTLEMKARIMAGRVRSKVVNLDDYREDEAPGYRPKGF